MDLTRQGGSSFLSDTRASLYGLAIVVLLVAGRFFYKRKHSYWEKRGIKGPKPWPIVGNTVHFIFKDLYKREREWARRYGKLYGFYQGAEPRLVIADADILRQICIKDFSLFPNHEKSALLNEIQEAFVFFLQDDYWKRVRAMQTPTFTSGKIKRMFKLLDVCADDLVLDITEKLKLANDRGVVVNLKELYGLYTMNGIASCAYGLKLNRVNNVDTNEKVSPRNEFYDAAMRIFHFSIIRVAIVQIIPKSILARFGFNMSPMSKFAPMANKVRQIIKSRRGANRKFDDYLQILLDDAKLGEKMELNEMDLKEDHHAGLTKESFLSDQEKLVKEVRHTMQNQVEARESGNLSKVELTEQEIISSALFLLVVGVETTATLLQNCTYALAFHKEIQQKLYDEVRKIAVHEEGEQKYVFDYDDVTSCEYLDCVISETLRALSPVTSLDRVGPNISEYCIEKYSLKVPKGSKLLLAYHAIMNDPDYWPEPEKFDPERFSAQNRDKIVPGSYCPFGIGPRHCLGMRFSLTEAKLGLAKMIMNYKFERAPNTVYPPDTKICVSLINLKTPFVKFVPREA